MKTSTSGQGRPKGTPNKATAQAREAIAAFVDGNAHRLQTWLDQIAEGQKTVKMNADGELVEEQLTAPNPAKAFELFQSVVEYHIPKLARTESTVEHSGAIQGVIVVPSKNTLATDAEAE